MRILYFKNTNVVYQVAIIIFCEGNSCFFQICDGVVAVVAAAAAGSAQGLVVGKKAPEIMLEGKNGGRVDGTAWKSNELTGKVHALFYVDPDEQKINEHVEQALKKESFPLDRYNSVGVINMGATWIPNFLISKRLKAKQEEHSHTTYVKDETKALSRGVGIETTPTISGNRQERNVAGRKPA